MRIKRLRPKVWGAVSGLLLSVTFWFGTAGAYPLLPRSEFMRDLLNRCGIRESVPECVRNGVDERLARIPVQMTDQDLREVCARADHLRTEHERAHLAQWEVEQRRRQQSHLLQRWVGIDYPSLVTTLEAFRTIPSQIVEYRFLTQRLRALTTPVRDGGIAEWLRARLDENHEPAHLAEIAEYSEGGRIYSQLARHGSALNAAALLEPIRIQRILGELESAATSVPELQAREFAQWQQVDPEYPMRLVFPWIADRADEWPWQLDLVRWNFAFQSNLDMLMDTVTLTDFYQQLSRLAHSPLLTGEWARHFLSWHQVMTLRLDRLVQAVDQQGGPAAYFHNTGRDRVADAPRHPD